MNVLQRGYHSIHNHQSLFFFIQMLLARLTSVGVGVRCGGGLCAPGARASLRASLRSCRWLRRLLQPSHL